MDDAVAVRGRQSCGDLTGVVDRLATRHGHFVSQRRTLKQFCYEIRRAPACADIIDSKNVGVIQRADGACLLLKAAQRIRSTGESLGQNLHCDLAAETCIASAIDFAHPARTERRDDFVRSELVAWRERHVLDLP